MLEAVSESSVMVTMLRPLSFMKNALSVAILATIAGCGGGSSSDSDSDLGTVNVALSGFIDIESGTRVDADNADALTLNPSPRSTAQNLPPEYVLAGYISEFSGDYPFISGFSSFSYAADPEDDYSMTLRADQTVELQAFGTREGASALRLSLLEGGVVRDTSVTNSTTSQIRVTNATGSDGAFIVRVESEGATPMLYVLSTAVNAAAQAQSFEWPDHQFVEGEAIVAMDAGTGAPSAQTMMAQANMVADQELAPGVWKVKAPTQLQQSASGSTKAATLDWIQALKRQPGVVSATPNYQMRTMMNTPIDEPLYGAQQWHYGLLNGPTGWQLAQNFGSGVTVAVMDTGLYRSASGWHKDLNANVVATLPPMPNGADFVSEQFDNDSQPGRDDNPADPGNSVGGSVYHGTHVAGTVAAAVNDDGGGGVAFQSTLLPVRVLGEGGSGSSADLLAALQWVGQLDNGQPRADIVNLSLGGLPFIQSLQNAISAATDKGVIFVAAAGNSSTSTRSYPAAFDNVFSVSAVDGVGDLASYSNFGSWIDLAAPGGDASRDGKLVSSTSVINGNEETYIGLQGTSMAAPHVSGVFALMKGENGTLDYQDINRFLLAGDLTTADCGNPPCRTDALGYGLLDAGKAASAALSSPPTNLLTATPTIVSLSSEGTRSSSLVLEVYGDDAEDVTIDRILRPPAWLSIDSAPGSQPAKRFNLGLSLNLDALEPGISERTNLEVQYSSVSGGRTLQIPVVGQQVTDQQARDAGRHFALLVSPEPDSDFFRTEAQTTVVAENGQYRFEFVPDDGEEPKALNEVAPGNYILVAGSDLDNDGLICHGGEACAEYPVAGLRQEITISAGNPIEGIRMTTSYSRPSISAASPEQLPRPDFQGYQLLSPNPGITNVKALSQP